MASNLHKSPGVHALAGAGGAVLASALTYPFATVSSRLQCQWQDADDFENYSGMLDAFSKIIENEGWSGLYSGLSSGLLNSAASQGVYFYAYRFIRAYIERYYKKTNLSNGLNILVAALAGASNTLVTTPISVINTRMTLEGKIERLKERKGPIDTFIHIVRKEGFLALWSGIIPSLLLVSNPTVQFAVFERLKAIVQKKTHASLLPSQTFLLGAISKAIATMVTYPYIVAKARLQMKQSKNIDEPQYTGTWDVMKKIWKYEGIQGFFKGLSSQLLRSVLNTAFLFMFQQQLVNFIVFCIVFAQTTKRKVGGKS